jgi:hypothetical protein
MYLVRAPVREHFFFGLGTPVSAGRREGWTRQFRRRAQRRAASEANWGAKGGYSLKKAASNGEVLIKPWRPELSIHPCALDSLTFTRARPLPGPLPTCPGHVLHPLVVASGSMKGGPMKPASSSSLRSAGRKSPRLIFGKSSSRPRPGEPSKAVLHYPLPCQAAEADKASRQQAWCAASAAPRSARQSGRHVRVFSMPPRWVCCVPLWAVAVLYN